MVHSGDDPLPQVSAAVELAHRLQLWAQVLESEYEGYAGRMRESVSGRKTTAWLKCWNRSEDHWKRVRLAK